jgi:hypothetical protein
MLAPTCFGSKLPSSGSFLDRSELLELQMEWVVYRIMSGDVACGPDCRDSVCCASQRTEQAYYGHRAAQGRHLCDINRKNVKKFGT